MIRLLSVFFVAVSLVFATGAANAQNFWEPAGLQGDSVTSIAINGNGQIFAAVATSNGEDPIPYIGVFRSDDNGNTWVMLNNPGAIRLGPVYGFTPNGDVFMGDVTGGGKSIAQGDDTGGNIVQDEITAAQLGTDPPVVAVAFSPSGEIDMASGQDEGLYYSDDNGSVWYGPEAVQLSDDPIYVACSPKGVLYAASANQISSKKSPQSPWALVSGSFSGLGNGASMAFDNDDNIIAGGNSGLFYSTDKGNTWTQLSSPASSSSSYALAIGADGAILLSPNDFLGDESGVYVSTDNGYSWNSTTDGLTNTFVNAFAINNAGYVFAATYGGVFKSAVSTGALNDVKAIASDIPSSFTLEQNHPNPVTSTTTIRFEIPESESVSLNVYDISGNNITVLANKTYPPGTYDVDFDASALKSGIYFYRMEAGGFIQTKSFIVLP